MAQACRLQFTSSRLGFVERLQSISAKVIETPYDKAGRSCAKAHTKLSSRAFIGLAQFLVANLKVEL
jgi:hypothetical protein